METKKYLKTSSVLKDLFDYAKDVNKYSYNYVVFSFSMVHISGLWVSAYSYNEKNNYRRIKINKHKWRIKNNI